VCLVSVGVSHAAPASVDACATRPDVLGLSRVVEIDAADGPMFGKTPLGEYDFLKDGEVVLTFDDGPSRTNTMTILNALDAQCTKATFFMVGRMAAAEPAMVREVARRGHTVGAHTWSHARLQGMQFDKAKDEIELGFSAVARAMQGPIAPFFRFPYLRTTSETTGYLKERRVASFGIDVDSRDFETRTGDSVKANVLSQLATRRKGILLFHDIQPSTAASIGDILSTLKARGFKVVHLVAKAPATTLQPYDQRAESEIGHRERAAAKAPLAVRSVVWSQSDGSANDSEALPWSPPAKAKPPATKTSAINEASRMPWYMQLLGP
jgi:peptidoglycan/xylan/chitin deacetylase (PgdA/CDA1 family)